MVDYKRIQGAGDQSGPLVVHGADITEMSNNLTQGLLWAKKNELAYYSSIDTMVGDVLAMADSSAYDLNLGLDVWLTESRWSTLIRQYVNPMWLFTFLEGVKELSTYGRGIVALDMQRVDPTFVLSNARANRRKRGSCMRFMTYRAFPYPTVSLYSRTSYLGYIGQLDLMLAHKIIEMAADMIGEGLKVDDFKFRWHLEAAQWHGFKSMAYIFAQGLEDFVEGEWPEGKIITHPVSGKRIRIKEEARYPSWKITRSWYQRIQRLDAEGVLYEDMKYGAEKRVRRRLHAQVGIDQAPFLGKETEYGVLDLPIEQITLDKMIYKSPESRAVIRKAKREKADALIKAIFDDDDVLLGTGSLEEAIGLSSRGTKARPIEDLIDDLEEEM
jgi:hypothetical protein